MLVPLAALARVDHRSLSALAAALIAVSGAATRTMHVVHHARPGSPDDFEGQTLHLTLGRALLAAPRSYFELPFRAFRCARSAARWRQLFEWSLVGALLLGAFAIGGRPRLYAEVCLAAQLTIPIWASHLPHRPPRVLAAVARSLVWTRAPLVLAFVFHDLHHRQPSVSCFGLTTLRTDRVRSSLSRKDVRGRPHPAAIARRRRHENVAPTLHGLGEEGLACEAS